ncbi:DNA ligase 1-like [Entelurus aequoreus]|uniref:DNA ligase 1-like n=1 Tax=Entelurus aequoreus TaxID=161455 RepID=UPI002B1CE492|nr:DNA ligase 1-like [Entelurus aequoreus]
MVSLVKQHNMEEHSRGDTDGLLQQDLNNNRSGSEQHRSPLRPDPCDFLLDAIDAQHKKLQVNTCKQDGRKSAPFKWSESLSKDTGLGSTVSQTNDTPMSSLDLMHTPTAEQTSDGSIPAPVTFVEATKDVDVWTISKMGTESHKEQVLWRLERLLGDACEQGAISGEDHLPSESICTEDFVRCFRLEMVDLAMPQGNVQELDTEEEAERTLISDADTCRSHQNIDSRVSSEKSSKYKPEQKDECPSHSSGISKLHKGVGLRHNTSQSPEDSCIIYDPEVEKEHRNHKNISSPKARCLAGVQLWNFDTVSIDSDLDSVCTVQVREHLLKRAGDFQNKSSLLPKAQCGRGYMSRAEFSLGNEHKDLNEESNEDWSRRSQLERASENMHSAWEKMNSRLSSLRQKCEKEEETLRMRKSHLAEVEHSLSELQLRRKHAMQDLERLSAESEHMETEKKQLEHLLKDSKADRDSMSCQLQKLQREKESCVIELRSMEEELKKKEQFCVEKNNMFVLERQELDRQLDCAKTELFSEQRRAREKLESMQQMLEETCEELLRVSEAETSLRNRCTCLEEKERQKNEENERIQCQTRELQRELGACKARVDTLEKMLDQKEQQLLDLQEQRGGLQAEGDRLRGELEFTKCQHYNALKEAREHTHSMMEAALKQQMKDLVLTHEQQTQRAREDEAKRLKNSLEHQKEESKKREEELHTETLEKVHKAIEEERRKAE